MDKREITKIKGNLGIKSLISSLENRNKLDISVTSQQIQAILYYMVDYWARYVEEQEFGNTATPRKRPRKQSQSSKQLGLW